MRQPLVPKLLFGNPTVETPFRGLEEIAKQSFDEYVPKQEFGNQRTKRSPWSPRMLSVPCPHCQKAVTAPDNMAGSELACPACGQPVALPLGDVPGSEYLKAPPVPGGAVFEAPAPQDGGALEKDLGVTALGAITSFATGLVLWLLDVFAGFSFYSISACFVIPAGAIISGGLGATGYYFGAKLFGRRPSPWLLLNMLVISVLTFFLIHGLSYTTLRFLGDDRPELANFGTFLATSYTEADYQLKGRTVGKMGSWGYVEIVLEILGFALGGFIVYGWLLTQPYCQACQRYLSAKGKQTRHSADEAGFFQLAQEVAARVQGQRVQEAIDLHAAFGEAQASKGAVVQSTLEVKQCGGCGLHWIGGTAKKLEGSDWKELPELAFASFHQANFDVRT